jgi:microcompartment protein CcmL/EutN
MKEALGFIETTGLIAAVEALDAMLKSSEVHLIKKEIIGGGIVTVVISGDVAAVKTAVDAGAASVSHLNECALISTHTIPRPDDSISELFKEPIEVKEVVEEEEEVIIEMIDEEINEQKPLAEALADWLENEDVDQMRTCLTEYKVSELRSYLEQLPDVKLSRKEIKKASKEKLMTAYIKHYKK